jgi:hypothetical protein
LKRLVRNLGTDMHFPIASVSKRLTKRGIE